MSESILNEESRIMSQSLYLPGRIRRLTGELPLTENTVGRSDTQVFSVGGMHLKIGPAGTLQRAARMQEYFHGKGLSSALRGYVQEDGRDYLLMDTVAGVPAYDRSLRGDMPRLARRLGEIIRALHETDLSGCPYADGNELQIGAYEKECGHAFERDISILRKDVLLHGDACLPNIFMDNERFYGFVDLGDAGLGDRHFDLYWTLWSMNYNFKTNEYRETFLDAYGRDAIEADRFELCTRICACDG